MSAEKLKAKRTTAKQQLTRKINNFEKLVEKDDSDIEEINNVFEEVTNAWNRIEERIETYVESLGDAVEGTVNEDE